MENYSGWFWSPFTEKPYMVTFAIPCVGAGRKEGAKRTWPLQHLTAPSSYSPLSQLEGRNKQNSVTSFPRIMCFFGLIQDDGF